MTGQIITDVKSLDLGAGVLATELVGFYGMKSLFTYDALPIIAVQTTLPFNVLIITYPWPWQGNKA